MRIHVRIVATSFWVALATPLAAQDTPAITPALTTAGDSTSWDAGRVEGREAANEALVAHRALIGFAAGVPIGFMAVPAAYTFNPMLIGGESVAVAAVVGVGRVGNTSLPAELSERAAARGPDFARGMQRGYTDRLRSRRMRAAAGGAIAGMATGAGLLVWAILHSD